MTILSRTLFVLAVVLVFPKTALADCYVSWNCGGSSQCADLYHGSSGRRGPFSSCADFVQQDRVSSCSCDSSGGDLAAPVSDDPAIALGTALGNGLFQLLTAPSQPKSPQQIEQERQAAIAQAKADEERQRKIKAYEEAQAAAKKEHEAKLDREAQETMGLLGSSASAKADLSDDELLGHGKPEAPKSEAYTKAYNHAVQCISRNAGVTCSAGTAAQTTACVSDYNADYEAGAKKVELAMSEAHDAGLAAGLRGELNNGAADPRAVDGCRVQWIEAYSRGHYAGKTKK